MNNEPTEHTKELYSYTVMGQTLTVYEVSDDNEEVSRYYRVHHAKTNKPLAKAERRYSATEIAAKRLIQAIKRKQAKKAPEPQEEVAIAA